MSEGSQRGSAGNAAVNAVPSNVPERPEDITAGWLSEFVQAVAPGAEATDLHVVDAHSGTTGRARLRVAWASGNLPDRVFVKLAPTDPIQRVMAVDLRMGSREARFYHALARDLPVRVPRPIQSVWTEDGQAYLMLLEDLEASGCGFPTYEAESDRAVVRSAVEELARLHGHFWASERFAGDLAWVEPPMRGDIGRALIAEGVERFGATQPKAFHDLARIYLEQTEPLCDLLAAGPTTLLHGDPHLGNVFVEKGRVGFLDWACVARGPALRDVAYFLGASVSTEVRRAEQRGLIRHYLEVLERTGAPAPAFDVAWRDYRVHAANAWVAATATLAAGSRMQPEAVGRRAVARANATIEDLATAEVLEEELALGNCSAGH